MNSIDALENINNGLVCLNHAYTRIDNISGHCFEIIDNGQGIDKDDKNMYLIQASLLKLILIQEM